MSLVKARKTRVEEAESTAPDGALMCRAHGCPMRWSVMFGEVKACSYHAWSEPREWPAITEALLRSGAWPLQTRTESPTVRDMKTRVRAGHKLPAVKVPL